ncbi:hypothetical protein HAP94_13950 [Acidithiobacillus ferrivorans]|nr:hypothetical protein [Acidithiobacillus ferrivorans]
MPEVQLKSIQNAIDQAGTARQLAENLFYGWGYNAYREENKLRADDLLVRGKVSHILCDARAHVAEVEREYRREHLRPPTRENPYPDAHAIRVAQDVERITKVIESLEVKVRNASVPENDRVWARHRNEGDTLSKLLEFDLQMVEKALLLARYWGSIRIEDVESLDSTTIEDMAAALRGRDQILSVLG